jgi:hypothetical protein
VVALLVGQAGVVRGALRLAEIAVSDGQARVRGGELRVEFGRALEERDRFDLASARARALAEGEGLQGLERRRGDLVDGHVEALDGGQGFAERPAHAGRHLSQRRQDTLPALHLGLVA